MDELEIRISFTNEDRVGADSFLVNNLWIEGVKWSQNGLELSDDMIHHLRKVEFRWVKTSP